jgi:hypothetical protein
MTDSRRLKSIALGLVTLGVATSAVAAQRTFVASYGSDSNNCSLLAPCRAFAAALGFTDANGEIIVLDSAGYGPVAISKSVGIVAPAGVYAGVTFAAGNGVTVTGSAVRVRLVGLTLNGVGTGTVGVHFTATSSFLHVERCTISATTAQGILVAPVSGAAAVVRIVDTTVERAGSVGAEFTNAVATIDGSRFLQASSFGVQANAGAEVSLSNSLLSGNGGGAAANAASSGTARLSVENTVSANNGAQGGLAASATAAGAVARLYVTRAKVIRNRDSLGNGAGITAVAYSGGNAATTVTDADIHENGGSGVWSYQGASSASVLRIERTTISGHNWGVEASNGPVESRGENIVRGNSTNVLGSITPITGT